MRVPRFLLVLLGLAFLLSLSNASGDDLSTPVFAQSEQPFGLPFAGDPGPNTWLIAQSYGNTTGALGITNTGAVTSNHGDAIRAEGGAGQVDVVNDGALTANTYSALSPSTAMWAPVSTPRRPPAR